MEKESERNINVWLPLTCPWLETWPRTQECALTGNRTSDPLVFRMAPNPLSHTNQGEKLIFSGKISWSIVIMKSWSWKISGSRLHLTLSWYLYNSWLIKVTIWVFLMYGLVLQYILKHSMGRNPYNIWYNVLLWSKSSSHTISDIMCYEVRF